MESKILITIPDLAWQGGGGVTEIYRAIALDQNKNFHYFVVRPAIIKFRFFQLLKMYLDFTRQVKGYDIVHINPSLNFHAIARDGVFLLISKFFGKKTIVSIHGWREDFEQRIKNRFIYSKIFRIIYLKVDAYILLGEIFKTKLKKLLPSSKALYFITPSIADNTYIKEMDVVSFRRNQFEKGNTFTLLFLSRLVANKGLEIVLKVQQLLEINGFNNFRTIIAGDGALMEWTVKESEEYRLKNIQFAGFVTDKKKHEILLETDALFFPTTYFEGLPVSILEAMLYGLPIITRNVGSISEWIKNYENGIITESYSPEFFFNAIIELTKSKENLIRISKLNHETAIHNFTNEIIKKRYLNIYEQVGSPVNNNLI